MGLNEELHNQDPATGASQNISCEQNPPQWLNIVHFDSFLLLLPPSPFVLSNLYDTMKSFVFFVTLFLLSLELVHAAHIPYFRDHRQAKRAPAKKRTVRTLKKRSNGSCTPPSNSTIPTGNNSTSNDPTPPNQPSNTTTGKSGGFPSLGFKMPNTVPSSLDGWWSDYKSDIGFLGFSYSVSECMFLVAILQSCV